MTRDRTTRTPRSITFLTVFVLALLALGLAACAEPESSGASREVDHGPSDAEKIAATLPVLSSTVTTVAGGEEIGYRDGPAAQAQFGSIAGLTIDPEGNVYIADGLNHRIRRLAPDGTVSTVAGSGETGRGAEGGYQDGAAAVARFNNPVAVLYHAGTLYVADRNNNRIRTVAVDGTVGTLAGSGERGLVDAEVAGRHHRASEEARIEQVQDRVLDAADVLVDGQPAIGHGALGWRLRVRCGEAGEVPGRVDEGVHGVGFALGRLAALGAGAFGRLTTFISASTGGQDSRPTGFATPSDIALGADGSLLVADPGTRVVHTIAADGTITRVAGTGADGVVDGPGSEAGFQQPYSIALAANGDIFVFDSGRIRKISLSPA